MNPILTVDQEFSSLECRSSVLDPLKKAPKLRASVMKAFCFVLAAGVMLGPACPCRAELANGIKAIVHDSVITYVEVEQQGAYRPLGPGQALDWTVTWQLRRLPSSIAIRVANPELLAASRALASDRPKGT